MARVVKLLGRTGSRGGVTQVNGNTAGHNSSEQHSGWRLDMEQQAGAVATQAIAQAQTSGISYCSSAGFPGTHAQHSTSPQASASGDADDGDDAPSELASAAAAATAASNAFLEMELS